MRNRFVVSVGGVFALLLNACALPEAPSGGPKDTTAPALVSSEPASKSVRVSPSRVVLEFDEYVALAANGGQPISSPPLPGNVRATLKGKSVHLTWDGGPLQPQSTYSLALGGIYKDITEGNALGEQTLVFSTGDALDSLVWAGQILDARSGKPVENWAVGLWPAQSTDSAAYQSLPRYTSRTDAQGRFALGYLPAEPFRLLAFEDDDRNSKANQGEKPRWAWWETFVVPEVPSDSNKVHTLLALPKSPVDSLAPWPHDGDPEKTGTVRLVVLPAANNAPTVVEWIDAQQVVRWKRSLTGPLDTVFALIPPGRSQLRAYVDLNRDGKYSPGDYWKKEVPEVGVEGPAVEAKANWETETRWDLGAASTAPERLAKKEGADGPRPGLPSGLRRRP